MRAWALLDGRDFATPGRRRPALPARARAPDRLHAGDARRGAPARLGRRARALPRASAAALAPPPELDVGRRRRRRPSRREPRRPHVPARPAPPARRARVRRHAQRAPRHGLGRRRLAAVPCRATTSTRSTGARRRGSRPRAARDEFVVRERFAEEAPRVVLVCDRRPEMALFPERAAVAAQGGGDADGGRHRRREHRAGARLRRLRRPRRRRRAVLAAAAQPQGRAGRSRSAICAAPTSRRRRDTLARALDFLGGHRRSVPAGSFLFVLSDFLAPPPAEAWTSALEQPLGRRPGRDPGSGLGAELPRRWTRSSCPLADADGRLRLVRLRPARGRAAARGARGRRRAELVSRLPLARDRADPRLVERARARVPGASSPGPTSGATAWGTAGEGAAPVAARRSRPRWSGRRRDRACSARDDEPPPARRRGRPAMSLRRRDRAAGRRLFGEPVTASSRVRRRPRPGGRAGHRAASTRASTRGRRSATTRRVRTDAGDLVRLRYSYALSCCQPSAASRAHDKRAGRRSSPSQRPATALRDGETAAPGRRRSSVADVRGRLPARAVRRPNAPAGARTSARCRRSHAPRPPACSPRLLGGAALLALVGVAAFLVWRLVRRAAGARSRRRGRRDSPLERALDGRLAHVVERRRRRSSGRRSSGSRASSVAAGQPALARRARDLAWAPERPSSGDLDALARDVRATVSEEAV